MNQFYGLRTEEVTELERKNSQAVREIAAECMVLLENDGTLPLGEAQGRKLALYGRGARHTVKGGTGSGDVNTRENVTIEQGLIAAGFQISTKDWLNRYDADLAAERKRYMDKLEAMAKEAGCTPYAFMWDNRFAEPADTKITKEDMEASETDTAIYVVARNSGEGLDRTKEKGDYYLTDNETDNLRLLASYYAKVIVLLNVGNVIDTAAIKEISGIGAVLLVSQTGNMGGYAVADAMTGRTAPSGRLVDTWAKDYEDYPSSAEFGHNNGDVHDEYYKDGIYVGYRYFDTFGVEPAYPFGYGKGYTDFAMQVIGVTGDASRITVEVQVQNTGDTYTGREVVQVYYSAPAGSVEKPYQELAGFAKTGELAPGEKQTVTVRFAPADMASYLTDRAAWVLEAGEYVIRVGKHSRSTDAAAVVTVDQDAVIRQVKNLFADPFYAGSGAVTPATDPAAAADAKRVDPDEGAAVTTDPAAEAKVTDRSAVCLSEISAKGAVSIAKQESLAELSHIALSAKEFVTETISYSETREMLADLRKDEKLTLQDVKEGRATVEELTAQLTVEEMAALCVGSFKKDADGQNPVGASSSVVPGAAADTISTLQPERGIPNMILADGPAGLRLNPVFKTTAEGEMLPGGEWYVEGCMPFADDIPADAVTYYQYCTAIPIATALAQSWNMELVEDMGRVVGAEMQQFHVHFWLAPGMNIHRNPLCGRNFEYYSEDPLLSGKCAAADTRGVQSFPGQGTTIKHFAGNNLEDNRLFNNSHISERALREIYLKGFEIAVKESQPYSIMTSYNLLNGTHAANHYELIQSAARDEWGFAGVVMTDWFTTWDTRKEGETYKYTYSSSVECIKAGNDLQMPGCEQNVKDIVEAIEKGGRLTLADLQFCVCNILKIAVKCI